jgi:hypothetical protein
VGGRRDRLGNRIRKRLMGLTGGVGMDTLVTTILVDVTIYASRRTHCQLSSRTPYEASWSLWPSPIRDLGREVDGLWEALHNIGKGV